MAEEWDDGVSASDDEEADDVDMSEDGDDAVGTGEQRKRSSNPSHAAENKMTSDEDAMLLDGGSGGLSALLQLEVNPLGPAEQASRGLMSLVCSYGRRFYLGGLAI